MEKLIFYDVEVFKYDSLIVLKNINKEEIAHYWFDSDSKASTDLRDKITDRTLVGYNNHYYDDVILSIMIRNEDLNTSENLQVAIKANNDLLIAGIPTTWKYKNILKSLNIKSLDTMQQIDVSRPSLKKIEGNMGLSILESDVDFNIDRKLTDQERNVVLAYCSYDVDSTIEVYKQRVESYFTVRDELLKMVNNPEGLFTVNTTTLSAEILLGNSNNAVWDTKMLYRKVPYFREVEGIPEDAWIMWENIDRNGKHIGKASYKTVLFDNEIVFGFGGLHGAHINRKKFKDVKLLDVASMYPNICVNLKVLGEEATKVYDEMRIERVRIKHTDPVRAAALKLILNSVYGNLKSQYSKLRNPVGAVCVCVYGQMALFDLCRELYNAGYTVMNINTDGVAFVDENMIGDVWKDIQEAWQQKWNLLLELDEFKDLWIQKDVNNYIAKHGNKVKTKGGECNKYKSDKFFANNDARIIQIALVENLVYGKKPIDVIKEHRNEPKLFQYVLKAGNTYAGTFDADGNQYNNVNRIFAANPSCKNAIKLYKKRPDGGLVNFPDMPERMYLWNGDVNDIENFGQIVDIKHYVDIVNKKLEAWR